MLSAASGTVEDHEARQDVLLSSPQTLAAPSPPFHSRHICQPSRRGYGAPDCGHTWLANLQLSSAKLCPATVCTAAVARPDPGSILSGLRDPPAVLHPLASLRSRSAGRKLRVPVRRPVASRPASATVGHAVQEARSTTCGLSVTF